MRTDAMTLLTGLTATLLSLPADATIVNWARLGRWEAGSNEINGTFATAEGPIDLKFAGTGINFAQVNGEGTNYWSEPDPQARPYTSGSVANAPDRPDIIALREGGLKTITFSRAVTDPFIALASWNTNRVTLSDPFSIVSSGCGYFGCGSFGDVTRTSFTGVDELHGIIQLHGTFDHLSFTDTDEYWHGLQIGISNVAAVPEPATWAMMIVGLGLVGTMLRRRRRAAAMIAPA